MAVARLTLLVRRWNLAKVDNKALARELRKTADEDEESSRDAAACGDGEAIGLGYNAGLMRRAAAALEAVRVPTREEIRTAILGNTTTTARVGAVLALLEPKEAGQDG